MKKPNVIWGMSLLFILISCNGSSENSNDGTSSASVYIDNGTDTTMVITIESKDGDDKFEYEVLSLEGELTTLNYGAYHVSAVTVTDSVVVDEDFKLYEDDHEDNYNLNLIKQDYIVENIEYIVGATGDEEINKSFTYQGKTYDQVDADVIKGALVVPQVWDYNLDEESPEEVTLYDGDTRVVKRKLYRASTFILYLELIDLFDDSDWSEEEEH